MAKILVVEDNHDYQELLQNFLENANYEITAASDGVRAAECAAAQSFDLILLDLMLPGIDGFEVCKSIREKHDTPVIMLTALDSESCQMRGYGLGIDDYITKPVSMALLLQKVEAVLRRTMPSTLRHAQNAPDVLHFEDLSLDPGTHTVRVCDAPVDFTLREFEILQELMHSPGAVVTRKTLVEKLWGYDFSIGDTRIVDTHMKNIRRKLGAADCIETIRGVGYRLKRRPDGQTDA
ncbi:MAG: response regulator transcription factor [Lachnospiraceae bacterium]|jgi:two-component system response regulator VanR|nr:response regulator transcription factor [Lachnospiraceae bacterium]MDE6989742.1 response regulator transcription factor [Lachnospiraceae bacterium]